MSGNAPDLSQNIRKVLAKLFVAHVEAPRHVRACRRAHQTERAGPAGMFAKDDGMDIALGEYGVSGMTRALGSAWLTHA